MWGGGNNMVGMMQQMALMSEMQNNMMQMMGGDGGGGASSADGCGKPGCKWCAKGECWSGKSGGKPSADSGPKKVEWKSAAIAGDAPYAQPYARGGAQFGKAPAKGKGDGKGGFEWSDRPEARPFVKNAINSKPFKRQFFAKQMPAQVIAKSRAALEVVVDGDNVATQYPPLQQFMELQGILPQYAFMALMQKGITKPMAIQAQSLPIILGGNDVVGVARTGSGKTLAYLLPAVAHIEAQSPLQAGKAGPIALALAPTRELAVQISEVALNLAQCSQMGGSNHPGGIWAACIYGGMSRHQQMKEAQGAHIIAATPGRLMDHIIKDEISMDRCTYFVLDEGDRMLDDGFENDMKCIASYIRPDRQMLFFSATWPKKVQDLAQAMCHTNKKPIRMRIGQNADGSGTTRKDIYQQVIVFEEKDWATRDAQKQEFLNMHLRKTLAMNGTQILVFVSRKDLATSMAQNFAAEGFAADSLHGGRGQEQRLRILEQFKNKELRLLATTDVMGRGLDIPSISHVVVFDMGDIDDYVHRIGRCCRGPHGKGHAVTLFEYNEKWPHLAEGLIKVLETSGQMIPNELRTIAWEVETGQRKVSAMKQGSKWGVLSGYQGGADALNEKKQGYQGQANAAGFFGW